MPSCSPFQLLHCSHSSAVPLCALQLLLPAESAHDTIYALGEVGMLQFKDLNSDKNAFQRTYANQVGQVSVSLEVYAVQGSESCPCDWQGVPLHASMRCWHRRALPHLAWNSLLCLLQVKRCDEMARKMRFFHEQVGHQRCLHAADCQCQPCRCLLICHVCYQLSPFKDKRRCFP